MNWYLKVVRDNYANFSGRARRKEYWMFVLINLIISYGLIILGGVFESSILVILSYVYSLAVLIPSIAVAVRRMHDIGKSGWMILVGLIPVVGAIWLIVLLATEGNSGSNEYGPDPKGNVEEIDDIGKAVE